MPEEWNREKLQRYLDDQVQEDLNLDYKGAGALAKNKKTEINKDVSAIANSAGGVIIYGIREYDDKERRHLPERFDPVDQSVFTREWLEQVISGIQPRIQGLVITPVSVGPELKDAIFVVEVPASSTAHQASDKVYYRRHNFQSVGMNDYEVRDVMNRSTHALIDLEFKLDLERQTVHKTTMENVQVKGSGFLPSFSEPRTVTRTHEERLARLSVYARNNGAVYAQYVMAHLYLPVKLVEEPDGEKSEDGRAMIRIDNTRSDYVGTRSVHTRSVPVLSGTREELDTVLLSWSYVISEHEDAEIEWEVHADNARVRRGVVQLADLRSGVKVRYTTDTRGPFDMPF
jgi:hypothetical protein